MRASHSSKIKRVTDVMTRSIKGNPTRFNNKTMT